MIFGRCGTWEVPYEGVVYRNSLCERDALRKRIDAAVKALQDMIVDEQHGKWVQWDELAEVVKILTGNSPTNLESLK
jgi:hypothetical protein